MAQIKITESRLRLINFRQQNDNWGADYTASIQATPKEAPSISQASILTPSKLGGRQVHCLSVSETSAALLALYNPNVWDLHEQRALSVTPRAHYLYARGTCRGVTLPHLQGTLEVADRHGFLDKHPKVKYKRKTSDGGYAFAPFPYVADLLLFLTDEKGAYALNWPIKDKVKNFRSQSPRRFGQPQARGDDESAIRRQLLESDYFADADIRTQPLAGEQIDQALTDNLRSLFLTHRDLVQVDMDRRERLLELYRAAIGADIKIYEVIRECSPRFGVSDEDGLTILRQGIWNRDLRVDLFRRVLNDRPLRPEKIDVLDQYAAWFAR